MDGPVPQDRSRADLDSLIAAELGRPAPAPVRALADDIVARYGDSVLGILFYGSCRRRFDPDGLVDLYILYDRHRRFHRRGLHALFNRLLPPNVMSWRIAGLQAKIAVLSLDQFAAAVSPQAVDTTIWARFAQPASLLYARDAATARRVHGCIRAAVVTAAGWARRLAPPGADAATAWQALFAHTYGAELRPERANRPSVVYDADAPWFDAAFAATAPAPSHGRDRDRDRRSWTIRRVTGKALNMLRLGKAAFTFEGGADYIAWKLERHAGIRLRLSAWQKRHPLLAAPPILVGLVRQGVFSRGTSVPAQSAADP